jgi:hypothetical protein
MIANHLKEISGGLTVRFDYSGDAHPAGAGKNSRRTLSGSFKGYSYYYRGIERDRSSLKWVLFLETRLLAEKYF